MAKKTLQLTAGSTSAPQCINFPIDKLPVELVHMICVHLKPTDLASVRLVSRRYAPIALQYMVPEAHLILAKDSFEQLKALAEHPTASKYVTSFFFEADKAREFSTRQWMHDIFIRDQTAQVEKLKRRGDPCHHAAEENLRTFKEYLTEPEPDSIPSHRYAKEQITYAYSKYTDILLFQRQGAIHEEELAKAMKHFPNLRELVLSTYEHNRDWTPKLMGTFEPALEWESTKQRWEPPGLQEMRSLLLGANKAELRVESLHCDVVSWRILDQDSETFAHMRDAISNVKELRLGFANCGFKGNTENGRSEDEQCFLHLEKGWLKNFVTAAPNLHRLQISFDLDDDYVERFEWAPRQVDIVGEQFWPYLHTVELGGMIMNEDHFISFCFRHASTLKSLALADMELNQGDWFSTFDQIRRVLKKLDMFTVNGEFDEEVDLFCDFDNDHPDTSIAPRWLTGCEVKKGIEAYFQRPYHTGEDKIEEFLDDFRRRLNNDTESDLDNTNDDVWRNADTWWPNGYDPLYEDRLE